MRRAFVLGVVALVSFLVGAGIRAQETLRPAHDGYWWDDLGSDTTGRARKFAFLDGYVEGINNAIFVAILVSKQSNLSDKTDTFQKWIDAQTGGVTYGQLQSGLDQFYSDYRNKTVCVSDAIRYVRSEIFKGPDEKSLLELRAGRQGAGLCRNQDR